MRCLTQSPDGRIESLADEVQQRRSAALHVRRQRLEGGHNPVVVVAATMWATWRAGGAAAGMIERVGQPAAIVGVAVRAGGWQPGGLKGAEIAEQQVLHVAVNMLRE